jgi:hypothetical protein
MGRLKEFFHEEIDTTEADGDEPQTEPEQLAELLDGDHEAADSVLRLLDGTEDYTDSTEASVGTDYLLPRIGVEGFDDVLKNVWEAIQRFVRSVINGLTNENKLALASCRVLRFQVENLKMESRSALLKPQQKDGKVIMQSHITALSVFYRPPGKIGDVVAGLKNLERILGEYYDYIDRTLTPGLARLATLVRGIDPLAESFVSDTRRIQSELERLSPSVVLKHHFEGRNPKDRVGPHLMGNVRLKAVGVPPRPSLNEVVQSRLFLHHSELTPRKMPDRIALPRFNLLGSDQCLDQVLKLAKLLQSSLDGNATAKRERAINDLMHATSRFVERAAELEDGRRQEKEEAQAIANAVRATTGWINNPYNGLTTNALRSMRGALLVCRRNIE